MTPDATPTERALTAEGARQFVLDKIEAASYHRNYRQACIDIQAFLLDAERAARAEPGLREALDTATQQRRVLFDLSMGKLDGRLDWQPVSDAIEAIRDALRAALGEPQGGGAMSGGEELRREIEAMTYSEGAPSDLSAESLFGAEGFDWCKSRVLAAIDRAALSGSTAPLDRVWDSDLTNDEIERLANALRRADFMNWDALGLATMIAGTVRAIAAARLAAASPDPAQGGGSET
jgi:hypothetical protein